MTMAITTEMIKELRQATGAGVLDCKKALEQTDGDMDKATELSAEKGPCCRRQEGRPRGRRGPHRGLYPRRQQARGVLVEVNCETDFVARTERVQALCHDLAMQVAARRPQWVSRDDVPADVAGRGKGRRIAATTARTSPQQVVERIIEGKLDKFYARELPARAAVHPG